MFYSFGNKLSYELKNNKEEIINNKKIDKDNIKAVSYSNNLKPEIKEIHNKLNVKEYIKMKSSLKILCSCNWRISNLCCRTSCS